MRARGRNAQPVGDELPGDGACQRAEDDTGVDNAGFDDAATHRLGDMQAEHEEGDEVEEGSPRHGMMRPQDTGRDDGGDRVGRIVHAVQEIEGDGDGDQRKQQGKRKRACVHSVRLSDVLYDDAVEHVRYVVEAVDHLLEVVVNLVADIEGQAAAVYVCAIKLAQSLVV